jgi:hypothetical protein
MNVNASITQAAPFAQPGGAIRRISDKKRQNFRDLTLEPDAAVGINWNVTKLSLSGGRVAGEVAHD